MSLPRQVLELEVRSAGDNGEPTLGRALQRAAAEWRRGSRDRELCLHLLFLSWYCNLEPPHLTGFQQTSFPSPDLCQLFAAVYDSVEADLVDDAEFLYVVGLMALLTPYLLGGDENIWTARSVAFGKRYRALVPAGLPASQFAGRGAYGEYFGGQVIVPGGY
jgi:hypothetical protein